MVSTTRASSTIAGASAGSAEIIQPESLPVVSCTSLIPLTDDATVPVMLREAARRWPDHPFILSPANPARVDRPQAVVCTYAQALAESQRLAARYTAAGYGTGHFVALLLENRSEHLMHKLALTAIGVCCVPVNPDYRSGELAYLIDHSKIDLAVVVDTRLAQFAAGLAEASHQAPVVPLSSFSASLPPPARAASNAPVTAATPSSILYTSGTTGRPKGCVLSHHYELASGHWYATRGGLAAFRIGQERLYNVLPLYHVNAAVVSLFAMMVSGGCLIQADRFQGQRWWPEVVASGATIIHYLGVIVPMLLNQPPMPEEHQHSVRFGIGGGVEPQLHGPFEERYGFPLIEIWGMTEMVRVLIDNGPERQVGTRAMGHAVPGLEVKVVDDHGASLADGTPGEMVVRHSAATPRKGAFSGYLHDPDATEQAWRGGWFHTGDTVVRAPDGMLHFVDRKKNIIRRSGENIAAAEIEAQLQAHESVAQVAVLAVPDEVREEEVMACIVPSPGAMASETLARALFDWCHQRLAYYKAPGWLLFVDSLPTTGTQKIQKHQIFSKDIDPRKLPGAIDLRALKKRQA